MCVKLLKIIKHYKILKTFHLKKKHKKTQIGESDKATCEET